MAELTAKESLRRWYANEFTDRNAFALANAYAVEHPPDDSEPLTEEWFRIAGAVDVKWYRGLAIIISTQLYLFWADGEAFIVGQRKRCKTRGDVRRLCAALGSPLKEKTE